jgi:hypothetical protein
MENRMSAYMKNALSMLALLLSLGALQSPLWRPALTPRSVTATVGGTVILPYSGEIEKVTIFQKETATLSADSPGQIMIHGTSPGKTNLLIRYKDGATRLYEITVVPG